MGGKSTIEWCDSTLNLAMGCDGCELASKGGSGTCYAEVLTGRYGGSSTGYPSDFYAPQLFPARLAEAQRWPDLTGVGRPDKPWLSGLPRHIFHGDMGDYWTESLPLDWLAPYVEAIAAIPAVHIFLTKRPSRMRKFWEAYGPVPSNFVLMTSVTEQKHSRRIVELMNIPGATRGLSIEPLLGPVDLGAVKCPMPARHDSQGQGIEWIEEVTPLWKGMLSWVIVGGESGHGARPLDLAWVRSIVRQCREAGVSVFVKQLGPHPFETVESFAQLGTAGALEQLATLHEQPVPKGWTAVHDTDGTSRLYRYLRLKDKKGGEMSEWPEDLRVREMPEVGRA